MDYSKKIKILASGGLLLTTLIWGFAFVVVKNSLDVIPPFYMLAFRFSVAFVAMSLIYAKKYITIKKEHVFAGAVLGFWIFLGYAFQTVGCKYTTAGKNAFITTVYVVLVPFLHWIISKRKPDWFEIGSAFAAFVGIGIISLNGEGGANIGDILTLACGVAFAVHIIYADKYIKDKDPAVITMLQHGFTALFSWFAAFMFDGVIPVGGMMTADTVFSMLYLGIFSTMIGYFLQNIGQKYLPASNVALFMSTEAVFGAVFSVIFLSERVTLKMAFGCMLIFLAIVCAETKLDFILAKKPKTKKAEG